MSQDYAGTQIIVKSVNCGGLWVKKRVCVGGLYSLENDIFLRRDSQGTKAVQETDMAMSLAGHPQN